MKKNTLIFILLTLIFFIAACQKENEESKPTDSFIDDTLTDIMYEGEKLISYVETDEAGQTRMFVDNKPFLYIGASIRVDALMNTDRLTIEQIEPLFAKAKDLGVTALQIPVEWKDIELEEDVFDYTYLDRMMRFANKYALKIEFLWFGTNMVGDTHSYTVPDYIIKDGKRFPKLDAMRTGEFWNYYGIMWYMDFNHPNLLEREGHAVGKMMDFIYEWDRTHGAYHPVIGIQILNEADAFVRWRIGTYQVQSPQGGIMSIEEGWQKVMDSLNHLGLIVKSSPYQVYTRTNFANSTGADNTPSSNHGIFSGDVAKNPPPWVIDIFNLEGIDMVGDDSYRSSVKDIRGIMTMYGKNLPGNYPHVAENAGNYPNTPSLILAAISQGAGYSIYDLITSPFYIRNGSSGVDQGILTYNSQFEIIEKAHYQPTKQLITGLKDAWKDVLSVSYENFAVFNATTNHPETNKTQTLNTKGAQITFQTFQGALAFALVFNDHILVFSTAQATMLFHDVNVEKIEMGRYLSDGLFDVVETLNNPTNSLTLQSGQVYKISIETLLMNLTSNTWENIGS